MKALVIVLANGDADFIERVREDVDARQECGFLVRQVTPPLSADWVTQWAMAADYAAVYGDTTPDMQKVLDFLGGADILVEARTLPVGSFLTRTEGGVTEEAVVAAVVVSSPSPGQATPEEAVKHA